MVPENGGAHTTVTRILSVAMCAVGIALIVRTLIAGGGLLTLGVIAGILFIAAGVLRLWLTVKGR